MENIKKTLADVSIGGKYIIEEINTSYSTKKKLADVGIIAGAEILKEALAPFGGLMRIKLLDCSMMIQQKEASKIILRGNNNGQ